MREEWAKYQIVIYTTTITVGVSYSNVPPEAEFDELFLYATASCALPRDIAQALLRARVIKSNQLWFCIEERCIKSGCVGTAAIEENLKQRKDMLAMSGVRWDDTPPWIQQLIILNENEISVSRNYFSLLLKRYLKACGNTLMNPIAAEELLEVECETLGKPLFEDIPDLNPDEVDLLEEKIIGGEATREEKLQLLKHKFLQKFTREARETVAPSVWNCMFVKAECAKKTMEHQFWNIVHEKQRNLKEAWKAEASSRYAEQAKTSLMKQSCIAEMCKILGIAHTCEEKAWSHAEFETLAPEIIRQEEKWRKVFGLRSSRSKKDSAFLKASHILGEVLEVWSGSQLEKKEIRKRDNGSRPRFYTFKIVPFCKNIFDSLK